MDEATPRASVLGMLKLERGLDLDAIAALTDGALRPRRSTSDERERLTNASLDGAPPHVAGDYPEWLDAHLAATFGDDRAAEGAALAARAPLDLRVNTLKADRDKAAESLADLKPEPTRWSPAGLRVTLAADAKSPAIHAEPAFLKGMVEVQDEGSQLAALLSGRQARRAGDRSLRRRRRQDARARGRDGEPRPALRDRHRQAPPRADPRPRLERSGARNVQVRTPRGSEDILADLAGRMDLVLIDAPCTGTGAWRRNPDAKWRVRPGALAERLKEQADALDRAAAAGEDRRPHRLCHLLGAGRRERRAGARIRRAPSGIRGRAAIGCCGCARRTRFSVSPRRACKQRRPADDAAPHRHRRIFRERADKIALTVFQGRGASMSNVSRRAIVGGAVTATIAGAVPTQAAPVTHGRIAADVCVIGAGFAGLAAAWRLKQAGAHVVVLEARTRAGGRSFTHDTKGGGWIDFGGQWVGPTQDRFYALIKEMGCETYPSPNFGKTLQRGVLDPATYDRVANDHDDFPGAKLVNDAFGAIDKLAATVDPQAPWSHPDAERLDAMTFAEWLRANIENERARRFVGIEVASVPCASPEEISVLHLAWLVKACKGLDMLFGDHGGAQQDCVIGGTQRVARRVAERLGGTIRLAAPVRRIEWSDKGAVVHADTLSVAARHVIVAIPPHLAGAIEYEPSLPTNRVQVTQRWPQGLMIKVSMLYPRAVLAPRRPQRCLL